MGLGRSLISGGRVPAAGNIQIRSGIGTRSISKTEAVLTGRDAPRWRQEVWFSRTSAGRLTSVDGPHDAEGRAADLVVGLLASDDLPEDDGPAEHVTLLTVVAACREHV